MSYVKKKTLKIAIDTLCLRIKVIKSWVDIICKVTFSTDYLSPDESDPFKDSSFQKQYLQYLNNYYEYF